MNICSGIVTMATASTATASPPPLVHLPPSTSPLQRWKSKGWWEGEAERGDRNELTRCTKKKCMSWSYMNLCSEARASSHTLLHSAHRDHIGWSAFLQLEHNKMQRRFLKNKSVSSLRRQEWRGGRRDGRRPPFKVTSVKTKGLKRIKTFFQLSSQLTNYEIQQIRFVWY